MPNSWNFLLSAPRTDKPPGLARRFLNPFQDLHWLCGLRFDLKMVKLEETGPVRGHLLGLDHAENGGASCRGEEDVRALAGAQN